MEFGAGQTFDIEPGTFNVIVGPEHVALGLLRNAISGSRVLLLYVCGNYSRIISRIGLRNAEFDVRRAFTASQLLSIAEEAHQTFIFIEHDPTLYSESEEMAGYVSMALRELSRSSTVVLYSTEFDTHLRAISKMADRIFCIDEVRTRPAGARAIRTTRGRLPRFDSTEGQSRLEGF